MLETSTITLSEFALTNNLRGKKNILLLNIFIFVYNRQQIMCLFKYMYSVTDSQTSLAPQKLVEKGIFTVSVKWFSIKMKHPTRHFTPFKILSPHGAPSPFVVELHRSLLKHPNGWREDKEGKILLPLGFHAFYIQIVKWKGFFLSAQFVFFSVLAAIKSLIWHQGGGKKKETQKDHNLPSESRRHSCLIKDYHLIHYKNINKFLLNLT